MSRFWFRRSGVRQLLTESNRMLDEIQKELKNVMASMQDLQNAVQRNRDAEQSIVQVLQGVSDQLKQAQQQSDPAAIDKVIADLDANTQALASAAVQGTPAQSGGQLSGGTQSDQTSPAPSGASQS